MTTHVVIEARARAFDFEPARAYRFRVDLADGSIRVWDAVAGYYTSCHVLGPSARSRLVEQARQVAAQVAAQ